MRYPVSSTLVLHSIHLLPKLCFAIRPLQGLFLGDGSVETVRLRWSDLLVAGIWILCKAGFLSISVWIKLIHMERSLWIIGIPYEMTVFHTYGNTAENCLPLRTLVGPAATGNKTPSFPLGIASQFSSTSKSADVLPRFVCFQRRHARSVAPVSLVSELPSSASPAPQIASSSNEIRNPYRNRSIWNME
ncbi:Regulator-Ty1 transposition protein [Fusarium oxysporum f. sp. albedinis]|nr:Regulator-Ty1 transposition protein [Fusarium oxysporum f. sp. albedinis]